MNVRIEGLLYDKIYGDLMMLVKSTILKKSAFEMNVHYTELLNFLENLSHHPTLLLDADAKVFHSEVQLYEKDSQVNHRNSKHYSVIREELYTPQDNESLVLVMVQQVGKAIAEKLRDLQKRPSSRWKIL
jgi:hypothetical protein